MEINSTIIVALITAIAAIIAPIITAHNNNKTQLKLKNFDLFYKEKSDIYQLFSNNIEHIYNWIYPDDKYLSPEYLKIHRLTYLLSNDKIRSLLDKLDHYFELDNIDEKDFNALLSEILKAMTEDLENYRSKI